MKLIVGQAIGYAIASGFALLVDIGILWLLVHFLSWDLVSAAVMSFLAVAGVAYALSLRLAFTQHRLIDRRAEFLSLVAIGIVGLGVNAGVIYGSVVYLRMHYLLAKCVAAGVTFTCNFAMRRQLLFVQHTSTQEH